MENGDFIPPVSPNASPEAVQLLRFLREIFGKRTFPASIAPLWSDRPAWAGCISLPAVIPRSSDRISVSALRARGTESISVSGSWMKLSGGNP